MNRKNNLQINSQFKTSLTSSEKGNLYERCARAYCRKKGFQILKQNLRVKNTEIDCLAWDSKRNIYIVIEVRGRCNRNYAPSKFLSPRKMLKLRQFAVSLAQQKKSSVRIFLLEVIGPLPHAYLRWGIEYFPEKLGLCIMDYEIAN